jgi:dTDP-4-dehydrorhamnose 3,5-epimerase
LKVNQTNLVDCVQISPKILTDHRGTFVKPFHFDSFKENNLRTDFKEQYYSTSTKGVLRGLHFQTPPKEHVKLVYCVKGEIMDAVVDLRVGSPTYGHYDLFHLDGEKKNMIYIPEGMAHGFYVSSKEAVVVCLLTSTFSSECDSGIRWDSLNIPWPNCNPILSKKDKELPSLEEFNSPFLYRGEEQ